MHGEGSTPLTLTMTGRPSEEPEGDPIKLNQIGISHLPFSVPNVKALSDGLSSKMVQLVVHWDLGWTDKETLPTSTSMAPIAFWSNSMLAVVADISASCFQLFLVACASLRKTTDH